MGNKYLEKVAQIEKKAFGALAGKVVGSKGAGKAMNKAIGAAGKAKDFVAKNPGKTGLVAGAAVGQAVKGGKKEKQEKQASVTQISALRRLAQKKKTNPILAKAFENAHAKAKIYK